MQAVGSATERYFHASGSAPFMTNSLQKTPTNENVLIQYKELAVVRDDFWYDKYINLT